MGQWDRQVWPGLDGARTSRNRTDGTSTQTNASPRPYRAQPVHTTPTLARPNPSPNQILTVAGHSPTHLLSLWVEAVGLTCAVRGSARPGAIGCAVACGKPRRVVALPAGVDHRAGEEGAITADDPAVGGCAWVPTGHSWGKTELLTLSPAQPFLH